MTDILLIHLPLPNMIKPPVGLFSIADHVVKQGGTAVVHDMRLYDQAVNTNLLRNLFTGSRWVGVSLMTAQIPVFLRFLSVFGEQIKGKVVVGGTHPVLYPGQAEPFADKVCAVAGEDYVANLIGTGGEPYNVETAPPRDWRLLNTSLYVALGHTIHTPIGGPGHMCIQTSLGCNAACSFCINTILPWGRPWRPRSLDAICEEIEYLTDRHGVNRLTYDDEYFFFDMERAQKLADFVKRPWGASARVRDITRNPAAIWNLAKHGGLTSVNMGLESGSDDMLRRLRKPHKADEARECASILHGAGVAAVYSFISGVPGETPEQLQATHELMADVQRIHPNSRTSPPGGGTQPYRALPGTELAKDDAREWPKSLPEWAWYMENSPEAREWML